VLTLLDIDPSALARKIWIDWTWAGLTGEPGETRAPSTAPMISGSTSWELAVTPPPQVLLPLTSSEPTRAPASDAVSMAVL